MNEETYLALADDRNFKKYLFEQAMVHLWEYSKVSDIEL